jgi:hypothetical protein
VAGEIATAAATSGTVNWAKYLKVITCASRSFHSASRSMASWFAERNPADRVRNVLKI